MMAVHSKGGGTAATPERNEGKKAAPRNKKKRRQHHRKEDTMKTPVVFCSAVMRGSHHDEAPTGCSCRK